MIIIPVSPSRLTGERRTRADDAARLFARNIRDEQDYCLSAHKCRLDGDIEGFKEYSMRAEFSAWAADRQLEILLILAGETA